MTIMALFRPTDAQFLGICAWGFVLKPDIVLLK